MLYNVLIGHKNKTITNLFRTAFIDLNVDSTLLKGTITQTLQKVILSGVCLLFLILISSVINLLSLVGKIIYKY